MLTFLTSRWTTFLTNTPLKGIPEGLWSDIRRSYDDVDNDISTAEDPENIVPLRQ
jgi:hypothetical protein